MTEEAGRIRVLVFGAGAVGSLLGGLLSHAGYDVTVYGRGPSIDAIASRGIEARLHGRHFQVHPHAISPPLAETPEPFDVVLLVVRSYAVAGALDDLQPFLGRESVLLSLQNGIGTEALITRAFPETQHVAGSLTISAELPEPGMVTSASRSGGICLAPVTHDAPTEVIAAMFNVSGISVSMARDYRAMKWSKLLLNQMANGIPAVLDWTPGQVYRHPDLFRVEQAMLNETLQVVEAAGSHLIALPGFPVPLLRRVLKMPPWIARRPLIRQVERGRGDKLPSLLVDLRSGRSATEARWIYGSVADAGAHVRSPAPINRRIHRILEGIVVNPDLRAAFRDQPELLTRNMALAEYRERQR